MLPAGRGLPPCLAYRLWGRHDPTSGEATTYNRCIERYRQGSSVVRGIAASLLILALVACGDDGKASDAGASDATGDEGDGNRPERPDGGPFAYECVVDLVAMTENCAAPVPPVFDSAQREFRSTIDMTGMTELVITADVCDPTEFVLFVTDSPTGNGGGGDGGTTSNDAEVELNAGTTLGAFANQTHPSGAAFPLLTQPGYVAASGCTTMQWTLRDQFFAANPGDHEVSSPHLLRLNPPDDTEGTPDAVWHLGINRTFADAARDGTGVTRAQLGLR